MSRLRMEIGGARAGPRAAAAPPARRSLADRIGRLRRSPLTAGVAVLAIALSAVSIARSVGRGARMPAQQSVFNGLDPDAGAAGPEPCPDTTKPAKTHGGD